MKSTVAKAILAPVKLRDFVEADVHPTTFREEPFKGLAGLIEAWENQTLVWMMCKAKARYAA